MKTMNKVMLIAGLMMGAQVSAAGMDFDFGAAPKEMDKDLVTHIKSVEDLAGLDAKGLVKAIEALIASKDEEVAFALTSAVTKQLASLNVELAKTDADHKALMTNGIFTVVKTVVTGKDHSHAVVREMNAILKAWLPILQATITTALLAKEAEALKAKLATVTQVRLRITEKEAALATATAQAKTAHVQTSTAARNMGLVESQLTQRLALMEAATTAANGAHNGATQTLNSAK